MTQSTLVNNKIYKFLYAISLGSYDSTFFQILFLNENTNFKYLESTFYFFERSHLFLKSNK